jgi:ankyrin repeat protein
MEIQKAARGQYAGKIWDEKPDMASLLLNATQLNNTFFSEKHILEMRKINRVLNKVITTQIPTTDSQGRILHKYITENNHNKLKEYIELFNFDVNTYTSQKNYNGDFREYITSLLRVAIQIKASTEVFRVLLDKKANLYNPKSYIYTDESIVNGIRAEENIYYFFINNLPNKYELMELFLEYGCWDINRKIGVGYTFTPLHFAISNYDSELVKYLLSKGADKDKENSRGFTAYQMVTEYIEIFKRNPLEIGNHTLHYNNGLRMRDYMEGENLE